MKVRSSLISADTDSEFKVIESRGGEIFDNGFILRFIVGIF